MGRSSRPAGGYDKKTQAADVRAVVTALGYDRTLVVSHDIGIMVAYAYAARYPGKVERLVVMDAPLPGVGPWDDIVRHPALVSGRAGMPALGAADKDPPEGFDKLLANAERKQHV